MQAKSPAILPLHPAHVSAAEVAAAPARKPERRRLTDVAIAAEKPGAMVRRVADSDGLYLEVRPTGAKIWRYRYRLGGVEQVYTIGEYGKRPDQVSIAQARELRAQAAALVKSGVHPRAHKREALAALAREDRNTFRAVAEEWHAAKLPRVSAHYAKQLRSALDVDILPAIGDKSLSSVTAAEVLAILRARESTPKWAKLVLCTVSAIYDYAQLAQLCNMNPAYPLRNAIGARASCLIHTQPVKNNAHIKVGEVPDFLAAVDAGPASRELKIGMRLLMLTALRPVELAQAPWAEVDFDAAQINIPAERMKKSRPHIVPLSRQALALLRELRELTGDSPFLFPEREARKRSGDVPVWPKVFSRYIRAVGFGGRLTGHGLRGTASTALNEARGADNRRRFDADIIEAQLAHKVGGVRGHYNHAVYLEQRADMLQFYADLVLPDQSADILPLRAAA